MVEVGTFKQPDDIYHMYSAELEEAMALRSDGKSKPELGDLAQERRDLRERRKLLHPPGTCPPEASESPGIAFKETQIKNDDSSDTITVEATMNVGMTMMLRGGEFLIRDGSGYDEEKVLRGADVEVR